MLFQQTERSVPKAAPKLAAAPSTPPASNSEAPQAVPNTSILTTALLAGTTNPTVAVFDGGGSQEREAEHVASANRIWKLENELPKLSLSHQRDSRHPLLCT